MILLKLNFLLTLVLCTKGCSPDNYSCDETATVKNNRTTTAAISTTSVTAMSESMSSSSNSKSYPMVTLVLDRNWIAFTVDFEGWFNIKKSDLLDIKEMWTGICGFSLMTMWIFSTVVQLS